MASIHPVILCGGTGTRLWPISREAFPKQFSPLTGGESLFQATLRRMASPLFERPLIMTRDAFRFVAREQAAAVGFEGAEVVLEPVGRDTAPAILSAALMREDRPDDLLLVAPSDHLINDAGVFLKAVEAAARAAGEGNIVTFGIRPTGPETGFGYLELAGMPDGDRAVSLKSFVEKPDEKRAAEMIETGRFLWNAGIFLFRVRDILAAFEAHAPDLVPGCRAALEHAGSDLGFVRLAHDDYAGVRSVSVDYAVMEKATGVCVVPLDAGWSDLGSWDSYFEAFSEDRDAVCTDGPVMAMDCRRTLLRSEDESIRLVGLGLDGIAAVATRDAVLVANMDNAQAVKKVVERLRAEKVSQADEHFRTHRPWGWYESLVVGKEFQVKRIMVKPGAALSLQSHRHRSEHWVVVEGVARVTVGDKVDDLAANQSTYIPVGTVHRLENPGDAPMYLIEVQTGSYLGEDDIIRYEDVYARV